MLGLLNEKSGTREIKIVITHLEKYADKPFLTNFRIDPDDPLKDIIMQRTNNIEEVLFRKIKMNQRRAELLDLSVQILKF